MRKLVFMLIVGLVVALIPASVLAGFGVVGTGIDLRTRLEVSNNGSDWYNYSAESNPGDQTLQVHPGDTVNFRIKMWNVGSTPADQITLSATTTNPQYIQTANIFDGSATTNQDLDGDGLVYAVTSFDPVAGTGTFSHDGVNIGTIEAGTTNNEGGTYTTTISSSAPDQTLIEVTMRITGAEEAQRFNLMHLLDRAYADEYATTIVRILVVNQPAAAPALPSTGANQSKVDYTYVVLFGTLLFSIALPIAIKRFKANY